MAITPHKNGFTLIIAVIFMGVVLSLGLALASLGYKQEVLASSALESQAAFYAADSGLECALRADEQEDDFNIVNYTGDNFSAACGGVAYVVTNLCYNNTKLNGFTGTCKNQWVTSWTIPIAYTNPANPVAGTETRCAVVTVYKPTLAGGSTYLFSQGYDIKCGSVGTAGIRFASRGLSATYQE